MVKETTEALGPDGLPGHDYFLDAVNHIDSVELYLYRTRLIPGYDIHHMFLFHE